MVCVVCVYICCVSMCRYDVCVCIHAHIGDDNRCLSSFSSLFETESLALQHCMLLASWSSRDFPLCLLSHRTGPVTTDVRRCACGARVVGIHTQVPCTHPPLQLFCPEHFSFIFLGKKDQYVSCLRKFVCSSWHVFYHFISRPQCNSCCRSPAGPPG